MGSNGQRHIPTKVEARLAEWTRLAELDGRSHRDALDFAKAALGLRPDVKQEGVHLTFSSEWREAHIWHYANTKRPTSYPKGEFIHRGERTPKRRMDQDDRERVG